MQIYGAGDNSFGQLGVGCSWAGGVGDTAQSAGALLHLGAGLAAPGASLAAGHYHSAAIDVGGRLYTWGSVLIQISRYCYVGFLNFTFECPVFFCKSKNGS